MTKLLVATGLGHDRLKTAEVIDLDRPNQTCKNLPDLPLAIAQATGHLYQKQFPIICGGRDSALKFHCHCHVFKNGVWTQTTGLRVCRGFSSSALISQPATNDVIVMTGGWGGPPDDPQHQTLVDYGSEFLSRVESYNGSQWTESVFPNLPIRNRGHCLIKVWGSLVVGTM